MKIELTDFEKDVLRLRREGQTFSEIAKNLGVKNSSQVQERYSRTLRKLRILNHLVRYDKELIRSADRAGLSFQQMSRLYSIMRENGIATRYKHMSDEELLEINGIGVKYLEVLKGARR